ncbi:MAG: CPBP family intramembrane glutamic endopeptidase [Planctomycetaceae bacterium]
MLRRICDPLNSLLVAVMWMVWSLLAQAIVLGGFLVFLLVAVFGWHIPDASLIEVVALQSDLDRSFLLLGVTSLGVLFVIVPSVRLWFGPNVREILGTQLPRREHVVFALATVVPIAVLSNCLHEFVLKQWMTWTNLHGGTVAFSSVAELHRRCQGVPFPILVGAMALGPAIAEELVFRGVIGKRLTSTFGIYPGILLTSILFAVAHVSPAHAAGTLPIGILLHWLYLKTGSIWTPILVHFCNNLLAISMVRFHLSDAIHISPQAVVALGCYLLVILALIHHLDRAGRSKRHVTVSLGTSG